MKTSLLVLVIVNLLTLGVRAQIPNNWTLLGLKEIYGGAVSNWICQPADQDCHLYKAGSSIIPSR